MPMTESAVLGPLSLAKALGVQGSHRQSLVHDEGL
jgi:hypothetical protein